MSRGKSKATLLALDAGVRQTGWAIFCSGRQVSTGMIGIRARRGIDAPARLIHLMECLDLLVEEWHPAAVAHSRPSGIHWPVPALELLETAILECSQRCGLPVYAYTTQEVRTAATGHPNTSKDELAYAVMAGLGLIGLEKTAHEWEAIAVGRYHLTRQRTKRARGAVPESSSEENATP
ncbi:MAG: hypothetical protein BZY81_07345 [SAR202 cluster bacterium Io17-Chloro-G4]|nr:MAG: hypothetical protein BZY81_07345 [SAR202 cluster bacterium Io17-Chloro-G4]